MPDPFLSDPRWYQDAVIYELHVRSFFDANDDGYGDFAGLRERLPYLERLGVNTLWLLPFLESPLKDDGYDTADYYKVLPVHGDLDDFKAFLDEAHARGMRVITELVLNHTSDQHPWFQAARDPSSEKHDWYVWSETDEKYENVRIIFTDTEDSNWSWDQKAQKYYWHRFFSHQPDLNYDNPEVRETMKEVMFFWFDMGIDGLRLDAVPYLFEREGTSSENLPETIAYIKELRAAVEDRYGPGKVLLAEANQWPEDTLPYFGEDAEGQSTGVQMAFNFPIMPRMYMALRRENRRPFVEMLEQTRAIPDDAQWAIFLRNHDELTLEMVTDEERDYMYHEYAADDRFRINVGIRRRLAPLLGGERRRIELMNALLLALPGSPILYYGDEIGMGDDAFLGDRNGVRTPMQWSPDKNGGFSRAPHHRLFMPPINRGRYGYETVNVEDADADPHSLLNFMRRLLALRSQHQRLFGRGTMTVLPVENQSVLVFLREYEGEKMLVTANLSRFAQSFHLPVDAEAYGEHVPVELFSQSPFPQLDDDPYHLVLAPHGFYWFKLEPVATFTREAERRQAAQTAEAGPRGELPVLRVAEGLANLLVRTMAQDGGPERLEALLPGYIQQQRWFGAKGQAVGAVRLEDAVRLRAAPAPVYLSVISAEVGTGDDAETALYALPLTVAYDDAHSVLEAHPQAALAWLDPAGGRRALLHDAAVTPGFWSTLFRWWQGGGKSRSLRGLYVAHVQDSVDADDGTDADARLLTGEQSNSAAIINGRFFVKLYRRLEHGVNPETELLRYLTDADFTFTPRLHGTVEFERADAQYTMGILQEALPIEMDGWEYAQAMTFRFLDRVDKTRRPDARRPDALGALPPAMLEEVGGEMLALARVLGVRTAELHLAFAEAEADALAPVPPAADDFERLTAQVRRELAATRDALARAEAPTGDALARAEAPNGDALARAEAPTGDGALDGDGVLAASAFDWPAAEARLDALAARTPATPRIRLHGDYHLGQVLRADGEFYILDFEGEPARSLAARRERGFALRDVAGMLRSLEYAVLAAWHEHHGGADALAPWCDHLVAWCEATFLSAYLDTAADAPFLLPPATREDLLWTYLFEKVCYEIRYEINHRPSWRWLPARGLRRLLEADWDVSALRGA